MRLLALLAVVALLSACSNDSSAPPVAASAGSAAAAASTATTPSSEGPCGVSADPPAVYDHVIWIWMENHQFNQVIGSPDAPYETQLASACGVATQYEEVGSPSLPNYIGATSGDIQGIHDDGAPSQHPLTADNLFRQVRDVGKASRSYQEGMTDACALTPSGRYAVKHNPAAYYTGDGDRAACLLDDVALGTVDEGPFVSDLRHDTLPAFSFITPDLCNDTHDCSVATGDAFLARWLGLILQSDVYRAGRTAVFVAWDEDSVMPNIVISPTTKPGTRTGERVDHFALLRTTEEMLGLTTFLGAAANAPSMRPMFNL
jgi:phospholipase C